jgi:hypothetical protein
VWYWRFLDGIGGVAVVSAVWCGIDGFGVVCGFGVVWAVSGGMGGFGVVVAALGVVLAFWSDIDNACGGFGLVSAVSRWYGLLGVVLAALVWYWLFEMVWAVLGCGFGGYVVVRFGGLAWY